MTQQIKTVHKDLLAFQERAEHRLDKIDARIEQSDGRFGRVEKEVQGLRKDMPGIVGTAMREVLRERRGKSRKEP